LLCLPAFHRQTQKKRRDPERTAARFGDNFGA
jgi:hypothetical protein